MLLVQEYLRKHTFAQLAEKHGVKASFSNTGHKWSLNYDQLNSVESDPLAQQCRGLILATHDGRSLAPQAKMVDDRLRYDDICPGETVVLAYPMDRFFNQGQGAAANVDFNDPHLRVMEKMDGTLTILYFDRFVDEWHVATRAVSEANLEIDGGFYTFRTLFEKALNDMAGLDFSNFVSELNKKVTYCFELTSPFNRVVVDYHDTCLTFLAARDVESLKELNITAMDMPVVPRVKTYSLSNVHGLADWVAEQNPTEHEGVVVMDSQFRRIKVKNPAYVAFNKARDVLGTSERNCLELVLAGKEDDVIPALPQEIVDRILKIKKDIVDAIRHYDNTYNYLKGKADVLNEGDKKTFALLVKDTKIWSAPMFAMFDGKVNGMNGFIEFNRKEGTWSSSFLDKLLAISKNDDI